MAAVQSGLAGGLAGTVLTSSLTSYRVLKEINRGGTAVVYEALDLSSGVRRALKVMALRDGAKTSWDLRAVQREVEYTAALRHCPNIVQLLDYFSAGASHVVLVFELIEGADLLDLLNECGGRMAERQACAYFRQLLEAVAFIHANGFCHRDIKPENCMVERSTNRVKLIDLGLSKHLHSACTLGVGTPDYLSPEMLGNGSVETLYHRRTGKYDPTATDVWAMGVLIQLLVSGQYAFEDPLQPHNVVATLINVVQGRRRVLPSGVSPECADLVHHMLMRDPRQRITLQAIASHPWLVLHGQALPLPLPPPAFTLTDGAAAQPGDAGRTGSGKACTAADVAAGQQEQRGGQGVQRAPQQAGQRDSTTAMEVEEDGSFMSAESSVGGVPSLPLAHSSAPASLAPMTPPGLLLQACTPLPACPPRPALPPLAPHPSFQFKTGPSCEGRRTPKVISAASHLVAPAPIPGPIRAVRAPLRAPSLNPSLAHTSPPLIPVLVESLAGVPRPVVPAQSFDDSPSSHHAKKIRLASLCHFWPFG